MEIRAQNKNVSFYVCYKKHLIHDKNDPHCYFLQLFYYYHIFRGGTLCKDHEGKINVRFTSHE